MVVIFEKDKKEGRIYYEVIRGAERDARLLGVLFKKYGHTIAKSVPVGYPVNLDVYKLKSLLEKRRRKKLDISR